MMAKTSVLHLNKRWAVCWWFLIRLLEAVVYVLCLNFMGTSPCHQENSKSLSPFVCANGVPPVLRKNIVFGCIITVSRSRWEFLLLYELRLLFSFIHLIQKSYLADSIVSCIKCFSQSCKQNTWQRQLKKRRVDRHSGTHLWSLYLEGRGRWIIFYEATWSPWWSSI